MASSQILNSCIACLCSSKYNSYPHPKSHPLNAFQTNGQTPKTSSDFGALLQSCIDSRSLHRGRELHSRIREVGFERNKDLVPKLLKLYSVCGQIDDARQLFDRIPKRNLDAFMWTAMISGYIRNENPAESLEIFIRMLECGVTPDSYTFSALLKASAELGFVHLAAQLHSMVEDMDRLMEIIKQAAREGALVLYTLADPSMAESAKQACQLWGVPSTDILGPTTEAIAAHLGVAPLGIPRGAPGRNAHLTEDYFKRIDAIDFTIKQDDGAQPRNLNRANIVLVGVSRTGKTPLSIYLAQKGYKVANVPVVMGVELPKTLFEVDQEKVFGLTINPVVLQAIRKARAKSLGFSSDVRSNYSEMDHVREELEFANRIFAQNPVWPVIEVTGKAIEETAAVVVRMYHDRKKKYFLPRISKRY